MLHMAAAEVLCKLLTAYTSLVITPLNACLYQPAASFMHIWLVLRLFYIFCVCLFVWYGLCIPTYELSHAQ